jgi:hypothetical protein
MSAPRAFAVADEIVRPDRWTLNGRVLDRRSFIGALSLTAAGTLLTRSGWIAASNAHGGVSLSHAPGTDLGPWHVDDMWGHMPRYAHPISVKPVHEPIDWGKVAAVDHALVS